jgi:hypothetical protein
LEALYRAVSSPLFLFTIQHHQNHLATDYLPYIRLPKTPSHYIFTLKMETVIFSEKLGNFQRSTRLDPESRYCTLKSSRENILNTFSAVWG